MKFLITMSRKAAEILDFLTNFEDCEEEGYKKLDNGGPGIMAVTIESLSSSKDGATYSITHYFESNGDLVPDPDMVFLKKKGNNTNLWFPLSFQDQAIYDEVDPEDPDIEPQKCMADFAETWLRAIVMQQKLPIDIESEPYRG